MKTNIKDTLTFSKEDRESSLRISVENYPLEGVTDIIRDMEAEGWTLVRHEARLIAPSLKIGLFTWGVIVGIIFNTIVSAVWLGN